MIQFHTAVEEKKQVCTDCIHGAENSTNIAGILWCDKRNCARKWFDILELTLLLSDDGNNPLRVFLVSQ